MAKIDKIEELQNLLKEDSQNFQARRQLALLLTDCGFNDEALKNLFYLSKMVPNDSEIFYNLGIVYEKLKNLKKAKESYEKAIEIEPDAIDAIYNLGLVCTDLKEFNKEYTINDFFHECRGVDLFGNKFRMIWTFETFGIANAWIEFENNIDEYIESNGIF